MSKELRDLLKFARNVEMTAEEYEQQRRSLAYGNTRIGNECIAKETIGLAARSLND